MCVCVLWPYSYFSVAIVSTSEVAIMRLPQVLGGIRIAAKPCPGCAGCVTFPDFHERCILTAPKTQPESTGKPDLVKKERISCPLFVPSWRRDPDSVAPPLHAPVPWRAMLPACCQEIKCGPVASRACSVVQEGDAAGPDFMGSSHPGEQLDDVCQVSSLADRCQGMKKVLNQPLTIAAP